jgi:ATP-dependent helicase/nuclease subunit A
MPNWTPQQGLAIAQSGCDLLVSASAGTGKTAVLTERIVRLAVEGDAPVDLDRFLVVTFTDAAALEMRERIAAALRERLAQEPGNSRIRHQCLLVEKAQISTLHSFCASLLRQHFHVLGLDPEFSTLDGLEAGTLAGEIVQNLFDSRLDKLEPVFSRWLDTFSSANPETEARLMVLRVHAFLRKLDDPETWTRNVRTEYPLGPDGTGTILPLEPCAWFHEWNQTFREELEAIAGGIETLRGEARWADEKLGKWIEDFIALLEPALDDSRYGRWNEAVQEVRNLAIPRLTGSRNADEAGLRLKEQLKEWRDRFKKRLQGQMAAIRLEEMQALHASSAWQIHLLLDLAWEFDRLYEAAKRQRGSVDFDDLEQLALRLLRGVEGTPSKAAQLCQDQYEYVLVDEYQDINPVQEQILSRVSRRHDPHRRNNLFAVGDVKQSIYAFRLAAPDIFLEKYDQFPPLDPGEKGQAVPFDETTNATGRVDLAHNFRSRPEVLDFVNFVFERLMTRETAGLDYGPGAALESGGGYPDTPDSDKTPCVNCADRNPTPQTPRNTGELGSKTAETPTRTSTTERMKPKQRKRKDWKSRIRGVSLLRDALEMIEGPQPVQVSERLADGTLGRRPARFRDVAVLMRSVSGVAEIYLRIFKQLGIPAFAEAGSGFLQAQEVRDVLNLLRVIDNPRQESPGCTAGSPHRAWTESEWLARASGRAARRFYEAVVERS